MMVIGGVLMVCAALGVLYKAFGTVWMGMASK
jgi:hypothetical protein